MVIKRSWKNWNAAKKNPQIVINGFTITGTNFRMTDTVYRKNAVKKMNKWNKIRRKNMNTILDVAENIPVLRVQD